MFCKNCGRENNNTNTKCEFCNAEFIDYSSNNPIYGKSKQIEVSESVFKRVNFTANIVILIIVVTILFPFLSFLGIELVFNIFQYSKAKDYEKTTAVLIDYVDYSYDNYEVIYEYEVNGVKYTVSPNISTNSKDAFKTIETVYYNPNKPSESLIYSKLLWGNIEVIVMIIVVIAIFVIKKIFLKRRFKVCGSAIKRM